MKNSLINLKAAIILLAAIALTAPAAANHEEIKMESWMTSPFEMEYQEDLAMESWMTKPFEMEYQEDLAMENWMSSPFDVNLEEQTCLEICANTSIDKSAGEKCETCP